MTQIAKVYAWLLANPHASISFREFEHLLTAFGFGRDRTTGSHRIYRHPDVPYVLSVQPRGKQAKSYQIAQFLDTCRNYGLKLSE